MSLNIAFMGTPQFAVPTLKKILLTSHSVKAVYSQPPRKSNRGMKLEKSPIHVLAEENNLSVRTPNSLEEDFDYFQQLNVDLVVVVAYGQIISKQFLQLPKYGFLNVHASLLPKWRGAAPIQRSVMAQDSATGISIMKIEEQLDSGPVLLVESMKLNLSTTSGEVENYLSNIGGDKILEAIQLIEEGKARFIPQEEDKATYAKKIKKEDEIIHWNKPAKEIIAQIHGLNPRPGACFTYKEEKIKIWKAEYVAKNDKPGLVMDNQLCISCGEGALKILEIQRPGKKIQQTKDFLLGFTIPQNTQLN
jgi:methionyl-tRNA formyltransferase